MNRVLVTAPTEEPLSLEEVKEYLREDGDEQDVIIEGLIAAARQHVENVTGQRLITQTWRVELDRFPRITARNPWSAIQLPFRPVQSITSVTYNVGAGAVTVASSVYSVDIGAGGSLVRLAYGQSWPDLGGYGPNAIHITFVVGYGDAEDVPDDLKVAMKLLIADLYENREAQIIGTISTDNKAVDRLLAPYYVMAVA